MRTYRPARGTLLKALRSPEGKGSKGEGIHAYVRLTHFATQEKPTTF